MDRGFFARSPPEVARSLLGHHVVHEEGGQARLRIVETEAYLGPEDPGSHATRGPDSQAGRLWEDPGQAYVYVCYGIHQMLNVVAHRPDGIGAVLLRAGEPVDGATVMEERRGCEDATELASGPGRLAQALGVTRSQHDGVDLTDGPLRFEEGEPVEAGDVAVTGRIGLSDGSEHLLRFVDRSSPHLSRPVRALAPRSTADVEIRKR